MELFSALALMSLSRPFYEDGYRDLAGLVLILGAWHLAGLFLREKHTRSVASFLTVILFVVLHDQFLHLNRIFSVLCLPASGCMALCWLSLERHRIFDGAARGA